MAILLAVLLVPAGPVAAQTIDRERIDAVFEEQVDATSPGLAVGVVLDGEIVYETYAGLANLEHAVPVNARTRFNIASNAKQFTALAILDLVREGSLSLDDDIRTYFPELLTEIEQPILIRHLLTHSSGIRDVYDLWSLSGMTWWQEFFGNDEAMALLARQTSLNFEPGTDYLYSNSNYILLAELIEKVSGQTINEATGPLFAALDMPDTAYQTNYMAVIPSRANGYGNFGEWVAFPAITQLYGDGWLYTTLKDQLVWERHVQHSPDGPFGERIAASQKPVAGTSNEAYGYGLELGTYKGMEYRFHDGSTGALNASFSRFPSARLSIVAISNNGSLSTRSITDAIADTILGDRLAATQYPERPDTLGDRPANRDVLGLYDVRATGTLIRITERDGDLYREIEGRDPVRLVHEEGNLYHYESNPDLRLTLDVTPDGTRSLTIYFATQAPLPAQRVPEAPLDASYLTGLEGRYLNAETDAELIIVPEDDGLSLSAFGQQQVTTPMIRDRLDAFGYRFTAVRDTNGRVTAFALDGGRLRDVMFVRETR
jgi:CubicO group peptidase (beta-lactamase class C family)